MSSPSGKTIRLGALCARWTIRRMIVCCTPPIRRCSRSRYSSMSTVSRATPDSIAALATAGAHHSSTRESNGFGMM